MRHEFKHPYAACVLIALRNLFGDYAYREELENILENDLDYAGGLKIKDFYLLTEYIPELFIISIDDIWITTDQASPYATIADHNVRYRIPRNASVILVYRNKKDDDGHAECIPAYLLPIMLNHPDRVLLTLLFNRHDMIIDAYR